MSQSQKLDYNHLIRTFALSCREEFDCLDAATRAKYHKTPIRHQNRPVLTRFQPSCTQPKKRTFALAHLTVNFWDGNEAFCIFCDKKLDLHQPRTRSHLLFECSAIPGSGPGPSETPPLPPLTTTEIFESATKTLKF